MMTAKPQKTYTEHARAVMILALPLAGSQLAQFMVHMTDVIMMGWYGLDDLAAMVLASGFWFIIFIFLSGFSFAIMPLIAQAEGAGDSTVVRRSTRMAIWLSVFSGVLVYPIFLFSEDILVALGQQEHIAALAKPYLLITGIEMVPALIGMVLRSYYAALERANVVLVATLIIIAVNALLNYLLIFGVFGFPEMGIAGAAISSMLVSTIATICLAIYATKTAPEHNLFRNITQPDWEMLRTVFRLGLPIGVTSLSEVGLFQAASIMMGLISTATLAAHGVAMQLSAISFMLQIGISNAAMIRAGNAVGRKDRLDLRRGALVVSVLSLIVAAFTMCIFLFGSKFLVGIFISPNEPQRDLVLSIGAGFMFFAALFQFADGGQVVALSLLRALKDTAIPMWLGTASYWLIGMPTAYYFGFVLEWGGNGVWFGLLSALTVAWILMTYRFWKVKLQIELTSEDPDGTSSDRS